MKKWYFLLQQFHEENVQKLSRNLGFVDFGEEFWLRFQSGIAVSVAVLTVMLAAGCSSSADSEAPVAAAGSSVISEASEEETTTAESVSTETEQETTAEPETETGPEVTTETEPETTKVSFGTEATSAELTAPAIPDTSGDIVQLNLDNVKDSYDTSYGSEIACAAFVLNYLGFNADEATLASYLPPVDESLSYIPSSAIKSVIESYLSDIGVQEYEVVKRHIVQDFEYTYGYPSIIWVTPYNTQYTQCFVLIGENHSVEDYYLTFYNPYDNTTKDYSFDDFSILDDEMNLVVKQKE